MDTTFQLQWHPRLKDPVGARSGKPRTAGRTMVIDKGLGLHAFEDLLIASAEYIDIVKIGFGTAPLYPQTLLQRKIGLARDYGVTIMPGGTFLEVAVYHNMEDSCFHMLKELGFNGLEISDGTIDLPRQDRTRLIERAARSGFEVFTEYGKKLWGSSIEVDELVETVRIDTENGAQMVIVEGRESGKGVGFYDKNGDFRDEALETLMEKLPDPDRIMWEAPLKDQQIHLLKLLGPNIHIGNVAPNEVFSLETLRRGLRSDTFAFGERKDRLS